jgi:hypothetical protein
MQRTPESRTDKFGIVVDSVTVGVSIDGAARWIREAVRPAIIAQCIAIVTVNRRNTTRSRATSNAVRVSVEVQTGTTCPFQREAKSP